MQRIENQAQKLGIRAVGRSKDERKLAKILLKGKQFNITAHCEKHFYRYGFVNFIGILFS